MTYLFVVTVLLYKMRCKSKKFLKMTHRVDDLLIMRDKQF